MPSLTEILQKLWAGMPGLVGLFLFLVTLGIFIGISAWEGAARRAEALRAEKERQKARKAPPNVPEPAGAGRDHAGRGGETNR